MYNIIGYKKIKYTRKSDNQTVSGAEFYLVDLEPVEGVEGNQCISVFLYDNKLPNNFSVGDDVELTFQLINGQAKVTGMILKEN